MPTRPLLREPAAEPVALTMFVTVVIATGLAVIAWSLYHLVDVAHPAGWLVLGALAIIAASFALKIPGLPVYLSVSDVFFLTSALLFGPAPATVTIAVDSLVVSARRRNSVRQLLFNTTSPAIALWCGAEVYALLAPSNVNAAGAHELDPRMVLALAALAVVYFLLNSGLLATAVALSKGASAFQIWREHFAIVSVNYFAAASGAFFLIKLVQVLGLPALFALAPLIVVCHFAMRSWLGRVDDAQRHLVRVNQLYLSTVSALSTAIEAKDGVTSDHIHRVQAYATGLARALEVTDPATLQAIESAALLHDTGKLGIPEHILNKPGKLTPAEFETMKSHVMLGADILSVIDFPYPVVPIVQAHHENWDGTGYPNGLRGEEIPIGARILSVVDCFDALLSDRPYRPAMTESAALDVIKERRGTMYDPHVVDTFLRVYHEFSIPVPAPQLKDAVRNLRRAASTASSESSTNPATGISRGPVSDDLLGFVSLARLTSGAPSVHDIGALAWSQLRQRVPDATLALFTFADSGSSVAVRYVAGSAAHRLPAMTMGVGERISGWVAAHGRAIVDADAALDLGKGLDEALKFALSTPLVGDGGIIGVMTLYGPEPFGHQIALTVEMIGPHLAKAVATAVAAESEQTSSTKRRSLSLVASR